MCWLYFQKDMLIGSYGYILIYGKSVVFFNAVIILRLYSCWHVTFVVLFNNNNNTSSSYSAF